MIIVSHNRPDGTPLRAECEWCPNDPWEPSPYETSEELFNSFRAYFRLHNRLGRVVPPSTTLGAYSPWSRGRRNTAI